MTEQNVLSQLHILYVEDELMTRNELSRFLKRRLQHLSVAENGLEALLLFENNPPDILISDLRMPDMDGLELTARIRALGYNTPIIITSALSDTETILSAVDRGIVKYLVKPIDTNELEKTLHQLADQLIQSKKSDSHPSLKLTLEDKKRHEKNIARDISALLKKATGKGPKRLRVTIEDGTLAIYVEGMLTPLETTLIKGAQSPEALTLNRELLYKTISLDLKNIIISHLDHHLNNGVDLFKYHGKLRQDKEEIYFKL